MPHRELRGYDQPSAPQSALASWLALPLTLLLVTAVASWILWDFISFQKVLLYTDIGSDTLNIYYPRLVHTARSLAQDGLPAWSFHHGLGANAFPAHLQFFPNWLLYALGPERLVWGLGWVEWLKLVLAGLFFAAYLRCLKVDPWVGVLGTLLLTFSGFLVLGTGWWDHSYRLMIAALLLWSIERYLSARKWGLIPIATALMAGPALHFYAVFCAVYVVFRLAEEGVGWRPALRTILALAGYASIGVLISSAWFLSDAARVVQSPRVTGEAGVADGLLVQPIFGLASAAQYWTAIYRAFSNDLVGIGSACRGWGNYLEAPAFYVGLLALLMFPQALLAPGRRKWIYLGFLCVWTLPVIFPWFRYTLNLFAGDYYKSGLSFFWPFAVAYLTLRALDSLVRNRQLSPRFLLSTLVVLLSLLFWPYADPRPDGQLRGLITALLLLHTTLLLLTARSDRSGVWLLCLLGVVCVEAGYFGHLTVNDRGLVQVQGGVAKTGFQDYTLEALDYLKERDAGFFRVHKDYSSGVAEHPSFNDALVQDYYSSPSYSSFNQGNYIRFLAALDVIDPNAEGRTRWAPGVATRPILQSVIGGKYLLVRGAPDPTTAMWLRRSFAKLERFGDTTVYENKAFVPFGVTYGTVMLRSDFDRLSAPHKKALLRRAGISAGFAPVMPVKDLVLLTAAVVEDEDAEQVGGLRRLSSESAMQDVREQDYVDSAQALARDQRLEISTFSPNHIVGTIATDAPRVLFLPMALDPGWTATIDGQRADLIMLNGGLSGLVLPPGDYQVELRYRPPMLVAGLVGTALGLALYLALYLALAIRSRGARRGDSRLIGVRHRSP